MALKINNLYVNVKTYKRDRILKPMFVTEQQEVVTGTNEQGEEIKEMQDAEVPVMENDVQVTEDYLYFDLYINIFADETKQDKIVSKTVVEFPYKEQVSDEDIYTALKQKTITYKGGFNREVELDLNNAVDC